MRKVAKVADEKNQKENASTDEKLSSLKLQMNILDEKYNQRLLVVCIGLRCIICSIFLL